MAATLDELTQQILALPIDERAALAQRLWASLDTADPSSGPDADGELLEILKRRHAEMDSGVVVGRSHSEVMAAAREAVDARRLESRS